MQVVPVEGDKIETDDGANLMVLAYTNYKKKGPAVYVEHEPGTPSIAIYFWDIIKINGVKVEYDKSAKIFNSQGPVKRKFKLPQVRDKIVVIKPGVDVEDTVNDKVDVVQIKLHNKSVGLAQGLVFKGDDDKYYRLDDIIDIKRAIGGERFERKKFLKYYDDYRGYVEKR